MTRFASLLALFALGCTPTFSPQDIVDSPRVIDIVAEPPEVAPGDSSDIAVFYADTVPGRAVSYSWVACVTAESIGAGGFSGAQYGAPQVGPGCDVRGDGGTSLVTPLRTGPDGGTTLPAAVTGLLSAPDAATISALFGSTVTDPALVAALLHQIGIPILVQVKITDSATGDELVSAFKRVLIRSGDSPNTNPPAPRFQIGDSWVTARMSGLPPFTCVPEDPSRPPVVALGADVTLSPDPGDDAWLQSYTVLSPDGAGLQTVQEGAYYAWLSTVGSFKDGGAEQAPTRQGVWVPPAMRPDATMVPLWFVVRDGHGGSSACQTMVAFE